MYYSRVSLVHFSINFMPLTKLNPDFRYLASGSLQRHIASVYRVSKQHVGSIIDDTCTAIYETLKPTYIPNPDPQMWTAVANKFNGRWNFPNCLGAVDGKHIAIKCPDNASSLFFNHKVR